MKILVEKKHVMTSVDIYAGMFSRLSRRGTASAPGLSKSVMEEAVRMRAILEESGILTQETIVSPRWGHNSVIIDL